MVQHSSLTGSECHEPKGADTATSGDVFVTDGSGSGSWGKPVLQGFEDYNDTGSSQSLTSGSFIDITNDGAGADTNTTYKLPGSTGIWDTASDQFDWAAGQLSVGDTVDIRFDFSITTTGANDEIAIRMDLAHGHASEYTLEIDRRIYKTAGTYGIIRWVGFYMGDTTTLNNPAKIAMYTDSTGNSVVCNGWYVRSSPRTIFTE